VIKPRPYSERARKIVHMAMGAFALLLRYIPWWQAAILGGVAMAFNLLILPRIAPHLYRPTERERFPAGIVFYPASIVLLVLTFPDRLDIVAAAWGILAIGDGMATLVGQAFGGTRIPWNREKSVQGSCALFLFGGLAGATLAWWCRPAVVPPAYLWFSLAAPFAAAFVAALVETIPVRLDDNISVPASSALVLWGLSLVSEDLVWTTARQVAPSIAIIAGLNAVIAAAGYLAGTVTRAGAIGGGMIGVAIAATTGWRGWLLLFTTFMVAAVSSRLGLHRKTLLGIAEERGGRRGVGNAVANTGLAAGAALMSSLTYAHDAALLAFAAALTAGGSDTVASEIGKAWGRRTYLVTKFQKVRPGTPGAVSLEGTVAGVVAALALGVVAILLGIIPQRALVVVVVAATVSSMVEGWLAVTLEGPGILNNDWLNFLNTAVAVVIALLLSEAIS